MFGDHSVLRKSRLILNRRSIEDDDEPIAFGDQAGLWKSFVFHGLPDHGNAAPSIFDSVHLFEHSDEMGIPVWANIVSRELDR